MPVETINLAETYRRAELADARAVDGETSHRVALAVSSEERVDRYFGAEILSHKREAVDVSFFGGGRAPLLLDHDPREQIGVVERVTLDSDKVLRAVVRFSKNARATEILNDVKDGIRLNTSVGYRIEEYEPLPDDGGYLITRWKPLEISIVAIPADESVGVGRSLNLKGNESMPTETNVAEAERRAVEIEKRANAVADAIDLASRHGMRERMDGFLTAEVRALPAADILARSRGFVLENLPADGPLTDMRLGSPAVHTRAPSTPFLTRAIAAQMSGNWKDAGLERELVTEAENMFRAAGRTPQGLTVPLGWLTAPMQRAVTKTSDMDAMIDIDHLGGSFVETLKHYAAVVGLGATMLNGLKADVRIPRWLVGATTQWVNEDTAPTESAPAGDQIPLNWHSLGVTFRATRQALTQSSPGLESTFRMDAIRSLGVELDRTAICGSGVGAEPLGLLGTSGIGAPSRGGAATNGLELSWAHVVALMAAVEGENIIGNHFGWLTNHRVKAYSMSTQRAIGTDAMILDDAADNLCGKPIAYSGNVPSNGTKGTGTNLSTLIYGNWSDLLIASFAGMDIIIDPYSESNKGNTRISLWTAHDFGVRYPEAFARYNDLVA